MNFRNLTVIKSFPLRNALGLIGRIPCYLDANALLPKFGQPEVVFFRLFHDDGLVAPPG